MFSYCVHGLKYVKYNRLYKIECHHNLAWYCKANFKINLLKLETKRDKLCPYSFKYINCKGGYQADSNICPFWKYKFNKEWHAKKYQELYENRSKSNHSIVSKVGL